MKGIFVVIGIIVIIVALANQGSSKSSSGGNNTPAVQTSTDPWGDTLTAHYSRSVKLCEAYYSLVNQGWTDDEIYNQLDDMGVFDKFYGTGDDFYKRMIRWCYKND